MRRTNIYLAEGQTAMLDRLAEQEGVSRAELIRRLIDRAVTDAGQSLGDDLAAIEEAFGSVPDLEFPARARGDRELHLDRIRHRRQ